MSDTPSRWHTSAKAVSKVRHVRLYAFCRAAISGKWGLVAASEGVRVSVSEGMEAVYQHSVEHLSMSGHLLSNHTSLDLCLNHSPAARVARVSP